MKPLDWKEVLARHCAGVFVALVACAGASAARADDGVRPAALEDGVLFHPASNTRYAADAGRRAHTFLEAVKPKLALAGIHPGFAGGPPYQGFGIETPASIQCVYVFVSRAYGCDPNRVTAEAAGGSKVIAIVDAYDYVDATSDLATFSAQFGLPAPSSQYFQKIYATGTKPASSSGTGWDIEASLDIEWAHAMAPNAQIVLVEAASDSLSDMYAAVGVGAALVQAAGGGQVSMSWGASEYSSESSSDSVFSGYTNVVFYAASGDSWGTIYPCTSPNVVCVGGTAHSRNPSTLALEHQDTWTMAGAGTSPYEPAPSYQSVVDATARIVPDVAAIADPNNGVWVYNCTYEAACYWYQIGGTSAATPITASLDNHAGRFSASSQAYLSALYGSSGSGFRAATSGYCGSYYSMHAQAGWNNCTGWGTPLK